MDRRAPSPGLHAPGQGHAEGSPLRIAHLHGRRTEFCAECRPVHSWVPGPGSQGRGLGQLPRAAPVVPVLAERAGSAGCSPARRRPWAMRRTPAGPAAALAEGVDRRGRGAGRRERRRGPRTRGAERHCRQSGVQIRQQWLHRCQAGGHRQGPGHRGRHHAPGGFKNKGGWSARGRTRHCFSGNRCTGCPCPSVEAPIVPRVQACVPGPRGTRRATPCAMGSLCRFEGGFPHRSPVPRRCPLPVPGV